MVKVAHLSLLNFSVAEPCAPLQLELVCCCLTILFYTLLALHCLYRKTEIYTRRAIQHCTSSTEPQIWN